MNTSGKPAHMELRLRELAQLFNSLDPSPFIDRDLDHDAEEFIVSWAREFPKTHEFELVVHLTVCPPPDKAAGAEDAVRHYFETRAEVKTRELRQLLRRGRVSLVAGLLFLAGCYSLGLLLGGMFGRAGGGAYSDFAKEGLIIVGWVAMWRPLEIFLYDWWPVRDERTLYERLSRMSVRLVPPPA